jgi:hypothetical protein
LARRGKLKPTQIRKIFGATETAKALGKRFGVSPQMIYLIRSGRAYRTITDGLTTNRREVTPKHSRSATAPQIDVNALADAIIDRLIIRLKVRGS